VSRQTHCPKCNAELPAKGRFCLECGLDLYEEGIHKAPSPWFPILVAGLIVAGVVAFLATRPKQKADPPEVRQVREATADLLALAADGKFETIAARYCKPDTPRYERNNDLLGEIVRGGGAPGLNVFRATCLNNREETAKFVDKYKTEHPELIGELLEAITFEDGALRTDLGGTAFGTQRTDLFLAWFLGRVFANAEPAKAAVGKIAWDTSPAGESLLYVNVGYPEPPETLPGVPSPTVIPWRRLGEGKWAITLTDEARLQELLDLLRRVKL